MWRVGQYVDDFGNKTNKRYVRNSSLIQGAFSNSATQDSALNVLFLINSKSEVAIQLYKYAGDNPVKAIGSEEYRVAVQDGQGEKYYFKATNYSDRLSLELDKNTAEALYRAFLKGGIMKFRITEVRDTTSTYAFDFIPDGYENAIRLLSEPAKK